MPFELDDAVRTLITLPPFPPIIRGWNRLEGRPRSVDYDRALRAEVRDALWMLTRQWQFGEFQGEDTGSPVDARVVLRSQPLARYGVRGQPAAAYDPQRPLEARVEREPVPRDLPLHIELSRELFAAIAQRLPALQAQARAQYLTAYPLSEASLAGFLDADAAAMLPLATRHTLDAGKLLDQVSDGSHEAFLAALPAAFSNADRGVLRDLARGLQQRFAQQYDQPLDAADDAWTPRFLEYQFACAVQAKDQPQTVLAADDYASGQLDWYAFDVEARPAAQLELSDGAAPDLAELKERAISFLPAPISFGGMPSHRYWEMENRKTEFADIDVNTTDVAKLLLTEFALTASDDWCVIPHEVDVGTLNEVTGLLLTDDFGERILVRAASRGIDDVWQRWAMFTLSTNAKDGQADTRLFVPPTLTKSLEGTPIEKVHFLRDEMANMAWAIERTVPTASGSGANGYDPSPPQPALPVSSSKAPVRYVLGNDVPANWFPFIPVHVPGSNRAVQLQRARMPGPQRSIRGQLLSPPSPYYINEEEVPRAGKIVTRAWQRARWLNGRTYCWLGRRVTTGKGEGSSGLAFDQVVSPASGASGPRG